MEGEMAFKDNATSHRMVLSGLAAALLLGTSVSVVSSLQARTLECGKFTFPKCSGPDYQYGKSFKPRLGFGGFGGGSCVATKTPVVFIHGNGDRATNWDSPVTGPVRNFPAPENSVYDEFKVRGYNECELFGITYLNRDERRVPQLNYHGPDKYKIIIEFIEAVKSYSGKPQVDVVAHSLGVSMTIAALTYYDSQSQPRNAWDSIRKFVNIAGGIRGLSSCLYVGYANVLAKTCGSEYVFNRYIFGFYPDTGTLIGYNAWTGPDGPFSMRRAPTVHPNKDFYTIHAGEHDQIHCSTIQGLLDCSKGALFVKNANVRAQLNVGAGDTARQLDFDFKDWSPFVLMGGDTDGIGHFKAKNNTGEIIYQMLNSDCTDLDCKGTYTGGPVVAEDSGT
jgi:pimeloyl-ACP methyl ester carboxylesterase